MKYCFFIFGLLFYYIVIYLRIYFEYVCCPFIHVDVDECATSYSHRCNLSKSYCSNFYGGYRCECNPGLRLLEDNFTCVIIKYFIHYLRRNPGISRWSFQITTLIWLYTYLFLQGQSKCDDKDHGGCSQLCRLDEDGNIVCTCNSGFILEEDGRTCSGTLSFEFTINII